MTALVHHSDPRDRLIVFCLGALVNFTGFFFCFTQKAISFLDYLNDCFFVCLDVRPDAGVFWSHKKICSDRSERGAGFRAAEAPGPAAGRAEKRTDEDGRGFPRKN